ncbi:MAG: glucose 1-dehydrogenase [Bacteroidota bacterium]
MQDFSNKVAVVTGAASGIGRAVSLKLAASGAKILVSDIHAEKGAETVAMITEAGGEAHFIACDVTKEDQVEAMVKEAVFRFGGLHIGINNAGVGGGFFPSHAVPKDVWKFVVDVNLHGVFHCMQAQIPHMLKAGGGAIVNISSAAGVGGFANQAAYSAAKHGVIGLTKSAALEYAAQGIRVNAVCPAFTRTQMVDTMFDIQPTWEEKLKRTIPMRRYAQASEIADGIVYLCSDASSFVTGHTLMMDGGMKA